MAESSRQAPNWYTNAGIILHADHHTREDWSVGAEADPERTRAAIRRVDPDVIQIHAKGNPGWTTYPSDVGFTPPKLERDVLGIWRDIARQDGKPFSVYYNLGRDGEIMKRHPEWNRVDSGGSLRDRMLSYASDVRTRYLWPQIDEIIDRYDPDGFWFDGSCFTVLTSYQEPEIDAWKTRSRKPVPRTPVAAGFDEYKELHRALYRDLVHETARRIHEKKPGCLVAVNLAYTTLMPEKPDDEIDYLTVDIADSVRRIGPVAAMMDGQGQPYDLMVAVWWSDARFIGDVERTLAPTPAQLRQEAAIILSRGGRFSAWDTPTPESALADDRIDRLAELVPWVREREPWTKFTRNRPAVSVLHSDLTHYANTRDHESCFLNRWPVLQIECDMLDAHHLPYEILPAWRLAEGTIAGTVLMIEDPHALRAEEVAAIENYAADGGRVLLTGDALIAGGADLRRRAGIRTVGKRGVPAAVTVGGGSEPAIGVTLSHDVVLGGADVLVSGKKDGAEFPLLTCLDGVYYCPIAIHSELATRRYEPFPFPRLPGDESITEGEMHDIAAMWELLLSYVFPRQERPLRTDAPAHIHLTLREQPKEARIIVHMINRHAGRVTGGTLFPRIEHIATADSCTVAVRLDAKPKSVGIAPSAREIGDYSYHQGVLELRVPEFESHQMVVIQL